MLRSIGPVWDGNEVGSSSRAARCSRPSRPGTRRCLRLLHRAAAAARAADRPRALVRVARAAEHSRWLCSGPGRTRRERRRFADLGRRVLEPALRLADRLERRLLGELLGSLQRVHAARRLAVVLLFAFHGATYTTLRTTGELCRRAAWAAVGSRSPAVVGAAFLIWTVVVAVDKNDKTSSCRCCPRCSRSRRLFGAVVCVRTARSGWAFVLTSAGGSSWWRRSSRASIPRVWSRARFSYSLTVEGASWRTTRSR